MSEPVSADPGIGTELAGYRIERLLGRGGMSVVCMAEDIRLERKVALKLLAPELSEDERFRERFLRESKLAASLDHPNMIPIFEAGEAENVLFIAMRYVEGTDLKRLLAAEGRRDPARAVGIVGRVAAALDAAHEQGLVHRDVKPGNVLISQRGEKHVYLSDFGLTKQHASESGITETGQFMGTADYVPPEQIEHQEVSGRTDECVLYECLTGQAPFRGESLMGVLWGHMNRDATPASEARPELPSEIDAVLARAMAKEPERRYATCGELAREAATALGLSAEIVASGGVRASSTRRWVVSVALFLLVVAAAVVALMLVIGGVEAKVRCRWRKTRSFDWTGLGRSLGLRGWDGRRRLSSKTTFSGSFSVMGPSGSRARKTTRSRRSIQTTWRCAGLSPCWVPRLMSMPGMWESG